MEGALYILKKDLKYLKIFATPSNKSDCEEIENFLDSCIRELERVKHAVSREKTKRASLGSSSHQAVERPEVEAGSSTAGCTDSANERREA